MKKDLTTRRLIELEEKRQREGIELIPSENYTSSAVRAALGSVFTNKYSEGYPSKRYYGGNENVDSVELLCQERVKKLFKVPFANVQPYSGSPANLAVYLAVCNPGETIMGLDLTNGGHLTHGWKVSATAKFFHSISYHVKPDGQINFDELEELVKKYRPKLIWCGATAYVYEYDFARFAKLADSVGAYLAADIAHVAGLIVGNVHVSPANYAHIITTTSHKTLRGPRGGIIMVTNKGIAKDPELADKINKAVFPGLQGGPHDNQMAALAIALYEASQPEFKKYARKIIENAQALAQVLLSGGLELVGKGTENHLILVDLRNSLGPGSGIFVQSALDLVGLTLNKNTVPNEPLNPFYPTGVRLGTPAATTRGLGKKEMKKIGQIILQVIDLLKDYKLPENRDRRSTYIANFKKSISQSSELKKLHLEVIKLAKRFPVP